VPIHLTPGAAGVTLKIKVVPGASRNRVVGLLGDALKVAVSNAPEGGAANRAVVELLAHELSIAPKQIEIVKGQTNPRKEVLFRGIAPDELRRRLEAVLKP
jgi:uncharacterized protein (TIGR00251 family)